MGRTQKPHRRPSKHLNVPQVSLQMENILVIEEIANSYLPRSKDLSSHCSGGWTVDVPPKMPDRVRIQEIPVPESFESAFPAS